MKNIVYPASCSSIVINKKCSAIWCYTDGPTSRKRFLFLFFTAILLYDNKTTKHCNANFNTSFKFSNAILMT